MKTWDNSHHGITAVSLLHEHLSIITCDLIYHLVAYINSAFLVYFHTFDKIRKALCLYCFHFHLLPFSLSLILTGTHNFLSWSGRAYNVPHHKYWSPSLEDSYAWNVSSPHWSQTHAPHTHIQNKMHTQKNTLTLACTAAPLRSQTHAFCVCTQVCLCMCGSGIASHMRHSCTLVAFSSGSNRISSLSAMFCVHSMFSDSKDSL